MLRKYRKRVATKSRRTRRKAKISAEENAGVGFSSLNVIDYSYDSLSRLIEADYNFGDTVYDYGYDVAGNMVDYDGVTRTFNGANQMTNDGTNTLTYDNNGNLTSNGSDTYTWDRANRLLDVGNHSYVYNGLGNRVQQTVSSVVTDYLNDVQPGLTKLLKQDDGTNVERFVHGVRGIHAVDDGTDWNFHMQDGLGSVRALVDDMAVVQSAMSFDPYGNPMASYGEGFGFTGEQTDANGAVFLRARYYEPTLGIFSALDPFEGKSCTPMSLNGYGYVHGDPINMVDPSGAIALNIDMSGTSRLIQQMTQAMVNALTLPFNPLIIKNINSGWCSGGGGRVGNVSKPDPRFYSRGTYNPIEQDNSNNDSAQVNEFEFNLTDCFAPHTVPPYYSDIATIPLYAHFSSCLQRGQLIGEQVRNSSSGCIIEVISHDIKRNSSGVNTPLFGFGHSWMIFTDASGQEWEIRAGQEIEFTPAGESTSIFEGCEQGNICANMRHYSGGPNGGIDWHFANLEGRGEQGRTVLKAGQSVCADESLLRDIVRRVNVANVRYNAFGINSNTFTSTLVTCTGIMNEAPPFDVQPSPPLPGWFNNGLLDIACPA